MSKLVVDNISKYYESLDDIKEDGYSVVKVWSPLQLYKLKGRTTILIKENFEPITYVLYVIFSPLENRYYLRSFHNTLLNDLYFYENKLPFKEDVPTEDLRRRIFDGNVYLLLSEKHVEEMKAMLQRVWNANRSDKGTLKYKTFIALAEISLRKEWHNEYQKAQNGFKTQQHLYETQILQTWKNG